MISTEQQIYIIFVWTCISMTLSILGCCSMFCNGWNKYHEHQELIDRLSLIEHSVGVKGDTVRPYEPRLNL
jgi:hypothetical protein